MTRAELQDKIRKTREEMKTAGPVHRRDLGRHLRRLEAQLKQYDRFRKGAA